MTDQQKKIVYPSLIFAVVAFIIWLFMRNRDTAVLVSQPGTSASGIPTFEQNGIPAPSPVYFDPEIIAPVPQSNVTPSSPLPLPELLDPEGGTERLTYNQPVPNFMGAPRAAVTPASGGCCDPCAVDCGGTIRYTDSQNTRLDLARYPIGTAFDLRGKISLPPAGLNESLWDAYQSNVISALQNAMGNWNGIGPRPDDPIYN